MEYLLGGGAITFALWALITMVRNGGLRVEVTDLKNVAEKLSRALDSQIAEYHDYKKRAKQRIEHLMDEVEALEDKQHAEIEKIEDPVKRRRRRRAFVADVLGRVSEEASSASSANEDSLPRNTPTDTREDPEDR